MEKNESKIPVIKLAFESFVYGCCETAAKSFFWLPEGANIFKRIGRQIICCMVADKTTTWTTETIEEGYKASKELYLSLVNAVNEEEENGGSES